MFTQDIVTSLENQGILKVQVQNGNSVYCLNTPLKLVFEDSIIDIIQSSYLPDEEIGGILYVKPNKPSYQNESILLVEKVDFIRNAIEDEPRTDGRSKKHSYSFDKKDFFKSYKDCINEGFLPLKFHTHPTTGVDTFRELKRTIVNWETSEADIKESKVFETAEGDIKIILPRILIVGYPDKFGEFFFGAYGGMISPDSFSESKDIVQKKNIEQTFNSLEHAHFSDNQKFVIGIGIVLLLILAIRYRKYSLPILMSLATIAPMFLLDTSRIDSPNYFSKKQKGKVEIYFP